MNRTNKKQRHGTAAGCTGAHPVTHSHPQPQGGDLESHLGAEELGPKQRPLARHRQVDPHTLGRAAAAQQRPLCSQMLRQISGEGNQSES